MANKNPNQIRLKVKDHSVSGEEFELIENSEFGFLETRPQPSSEKIPDYYKSEDYISHTDSKRNLFEKVYHWIRRISLKKKLDLINAVTSRREQKDTSTGKKLLDVGCGTGDFLQTALKDNWIISGIEPNQQARNIANKKTSDSVFDIEQLLKFDANSFDVITLWHVLEHLPNLESHIMIFKKILKKDGTLVFAVPNHRSYDAKYYKRFWAAYDVPRHLWHFNQGSVLKLTLKFGLEVVKIKPMWFDAFYVSLLSEKYKSGKMNPVKGFYVGLLSNLKAIESKEASSLIYVVKKA